MRQVFHGRSTMGACAAESVASPHPTDDVSVGITLLDAPVIPAHAERAHAMKNCLSVIIAVARLVEAELSPRSRERMARLEAAAARLRELLAADLCDAPAPEARPASSLQAKAQSACISTLVAEMSARLADRADASNVRLVVECAGGHIVGVQADLHEALFNVVSNAIEATPPGGQVLVATEVTRDEDHVWTVTDTGCGIPSSRLALLGRPFSTAREGGSGVGLAFARKVLAEHGGVLHVESTVGAGTRVSLWLPRDAERLPTA